MPIEKKSNDEDAVVEEVKTEVEAEETEDTHELISGTKKRTRKGIVTPSNPPLHELNALTKKAVASGVDRNTRLEQAIKKSKDKFLADEVKAAKK